MSGTTLAACINFGPPGLRDPRGRALDLWETVEAIGCTKVYASELHDEQKAALLKDYPYLRIVGGDVNAYRNSRGKLVGRHARTGLIYDTRPGRWIVHDETQIVVKAPVRELHLPVALAQWTPNYARELGAGIHLLSGPSQARHLVRAVNARTIRRRVRDLRHVETPTGERVWVPAALGGDWNDTRLPMGLRQVRHRIDGVAVVGDDIRIDAHPASLIDTPRRRLNDHMVLIARQTLAPGVGDVRVANHLHRHVDHPHENRGPR